MTQTIFALASGALPSGVAVIRVSGPAAGRAVESLTGRALPPPRQAVLVPLRHPADGDLLDRGLVFWFPGPASFTGEDTAEFQVHGGRAVVAGVLEALGGLPELVPAEAGAFARQAFDNGKLDLTAVEGLADLVNAETAAQRRQALRQMDGALGQVFEDWRRRLLETRAHLEATIDFADEDLPEAVLPESRRALAALRAEMAAHLAEGERGEALRTGLYLAIIGPPNAGKSSLLNRLARRDAAIVAETAGTTRDVIEVHLDLGGYPVIVADTAGLREAGEDTIEAEGMRRARARAEGADLRLAVLAAPEAETLDPETARLIDDDTLVVLNKIDLMPDPTPDSPIAGQAVLPVSLKTGKGVEVLMDRLQATVAERLGGLGAATANRLRHRQALETCLARLDAADATTDPELVAEELRLAATNLARITGRLGVEDMLDIIFADFCIGK